MSVGMRPSPWATRPCTDCGRAIEGADVMTGRCMACRRQRLAQIVPWREGWGPRSPLPAGHPVSCAVIGLTPWIKEEEPKT